MNVSIGAHWERFVDTAVSEGRYASASDVMREGLRLVQEREQTLTSLRDTIQASIAEGGSHSWNEVMNDIQARRDHRGTQRD